MMIWILCSTGTLVVGYPSSAELNVPTQIGGLLDLLVVLLPTYLTLHTFLQDPLHSASTSQANVYMYLLPPTSRYENDLSCSLVRLLDNVHIHAMHTGHVPELLSRIRHIRHIPGTCIYFFSFSQLFCLKYQQVTKLLTKFINHVGWVA